MKSIVYDLLYRSWAPWDSIGVRSDLVTFLDTRSIDPQRYPRSIDVGCGTGANVVYLSERGFEAWGVDFSRVAVDKAEARAKSSDVAASFLVGDLTADTIEGVEGPFDLLIDFGTLDDLRSAGRVAMAKTITRISRPGSVFLEYCFYGSRQELPLMAMGPSKLSHIAPGELDELFGAHWKVEPFAEYPDWRTAVFVLTRR